jgi:hypothetical protein
MTTIASTVSVDLLCPNHTSSSCTKRTAFERPLWQAKHVWTNAPCRRKLGADFWNIFKRTDYMVCCSCRNVFDKSAQRPHDAVKCALQNSQHSRCAAATKMANDLRLLCHECYEIHGPDQACLWGQYSDPAIFRLSEQQVLQHQQFLAQGR